VLPDLLDELFHARVRLAAGGFGNLRHGIE
jgi:hypothetical protein